MYIADFQSIRPRFELSQKETLEWIAAAHAKAGAPYEKIKEELFKLGTSIHNRGVHLWDSFFPGIANAGFKKRSECFAAAAEEILEQFYPKDSPAPQHLIHVTCTGYVAPSAAQKLVSKRGYSTIVTHAYHMGCYASLPAIRIARGFLEPVDIVHTELCSLHMNPAQHKTENLIVQSLFADGFIKYSVFPEEKKSCLKVLAIHDEIIPNSTHAMTWSCEDFGLGMTLSKDVPLLVGRALGSFLKTLCEKAQVSDLSLAEFAVHPGGPKILDQVSALLKLEKKQMERSKEVLQNYGNMSSATLPHIWEKILKDPKSGNLIVSLAFGPGLTISGSIMRKI